MSGVRSFKSLLFFAGLLATVGLWKLSQSYFSKADSEAQEWDYYASGDFLKEHIDSTLDFESQKSPRVALANQHVGYSAVIIYFVSLDQLRELLLSLSYFHQNVPTKPWPILLMYEADLDDESKRIEFTLRLYEFLGGGTEARWFIDRIEWTRLYLSLPDHLSHDKEVLEPAFADSWPEYHKKNAFFSTEILQHMRLREVNYYLRLDADAYFYKPLCYDPIELFHSHGLSYAYNTWPSGSDSDWVPLGLWSLVDEYSRGHTEIQDNLKKNDWVWTPDRSGSGGGLDVGGKGSEEAAPDFSDFEILNVRKWKEKREIRAWMEEIKRFPERLYKYGWSDNAIRYATINMFFDVKKDVEEFCGMDYWHNGVERKRCSCSSQHSITRPEI